MAREACEQQARRAHGKRVEVLHVFAVGPRAFVLQIWVQKRCSFADTASIRQLEGASVGSDIFQGLAEGGHDIEIKNGVAVGLCPGRLLREGAVGAQLVRQKYGGVLAIDLIAGFAVDDELGRVAMIRIVNNQR